MNRIMSKAQAVLGAPAARLVSAPAQPVPQPVLLALDGTLGLADLRQYRTRVFGNPLASVECRILAI